jgi:hypothetical protein
MQTDAITLAQTSQGVPCGPDAVEVSVIYAPLSGF